MKRFGTFSWAALIVVFLIGLVGRIYAAYYQPIWLDEQYSLYFSQSLKLPQFFIGVPDVHPGFYYFFVWACSQISGGLFFLRAATSIIPSLIGTLLIVYVTHLWFRYSPRVLLVVSVLLWCNPFLVNLGWQLRMYGMLTLAIGLIVWALYLWKTKRNYRNFFVLVAAFLYAQSVSYLAVFLPIGFLFWEYTLIVERRNQLVKYGAVYLCIFSGLYFLLQTLGGTRDRFLELSWIPDMSLQNAVHIVATISGISFNTMLAERAPTLFEWLFASVLILCVCVLFWKLHAKNTLFSSPFFSFFVVPTACMLAVSTILPFISHRIFFHTFIPDVSFILPRSLSVQYILGCIFAPALLKQVQFNRKNEALIIMLFMGIFSWHLTVYSVFLRPLYASQEEATTAYRLSQNSASSDQIWLPSWFLFRSIIQQSTVNQTFKSVYEKSTKAEDLFLRTAQTGPAQELCDVLRGNHVIVKNEALVNRNAKMNNTQILESCCVPEYLAQEENIVEWVCK